MYYASKRSAASIRMTDGEVKNTFRPIGLLYRVTQTLKVLSHHDAAMCSAMQHRTARRATPHVAATQCTGSGVKEPSSPHSTTPTPKIFARMWVSVSVSASWNAGFSLRLAGSQRSSCFLVHVYLLLTEHHLSYILHIFSEMFFLGDIFSPKDA